MEKRRLELDEQEQKQMWVRRDFGLTRVRLRW
jgi:hypothetical protein